MVYHQTASMRREKYDVEITYKIMRLHNVYIRYITTVHTPAAVIYRHIFTNLHNEEVRVGHLT